MAYRPPVATSLQPEIPLAKILIVEDDQETRVLLNAILRVELGHEVVFASDGESGLQRYRETQPDLVVTDLVMPHLHGIVMIERLKELYPGCRIIAISGRAPEQLERARDAGASATLLKPIDPAALVEAVDDALEELDLWERRPNQDPEGPVGDILRYPIMPGAEREDDEVGIPGEGGGGAELDEKGWGRRSQVRTNTLIDLSHVIEDRMITYKGLPAPVICDYLSHGASREHYGDGTEFQIGEITMVANTGTYLDSPFHRFSEARDVSELPLSSIAALEGVLVEAEGSGRSIGVETFEDADVAGRAVLVWTGWSRHWRTDRYFEGHPFLTRAAAEYLVAAGARLVGIDSLNIDDTDDSTRPVHTVLLGADIPIVEHLRGLDQLRGRSFRFHAVPVKVRGFGSFPVRAYAEVEPKPDER